MVASFVLIHAMVELTFMKTLFVRLLISLALLGTVFLFLAPHVRPDDIRQALASFSWSVLFSAFLLSLLVSFMKAARFHLLTHRIGLRISFFQSCKVFFSSQAATPLPGGETVRALLLKKEMHAHAIDAAGPVLTQAIIELIAAVAIVLAGSFFYPSVRWIAVLLLLLLVPLIVFMFYPIGAKYFLGWIMPWKRSHPWITKLLNMQDDIHTMMTPRHGTIPVFSISVIGLAFIADAIGALLILLLSNRLGLAVHFFDALYLYTTSVAISGLLWVIPGGLGVTEGGMLGLLHLMHAPVGKAISLVVIFRVATLLFPVVLGLVVLILFYGRSWLVDAHRHT